MNRKFQTTLAVLATLAVGGCALAPGQHLDHGSLTSSSSAENGTVELVPITPKLLAIEDAALSAETIPSALSAYIPPAYKIGVGDVLQIIVWDHPELSTPVATTQTTQQVPTTAGDPNGRQVQPDGTLFFPYVGTIPANGKTIAELRTLLAKSLAHWIPMPQVDITPMRINSAKVTFSGAFERNQEQSIGPTPLSLMAALGNAGIKPAEADLTTLTIKRDGMEYQLDLDALNRSSSKLSSIFVKPGDHIHLPYNDRRRTYVAGEVVRPGSISFKTRSMPLADVIGQAGGIRQDSANGDAIYVIRGISNADQKPIQVYQLEARSPVAMVLASRFEVKPQDVVFVGPASITRWNRVISQLVPSGQFIYFGASTKTQLLNN